ncbi:MAG: DMT family transporter [Colwelliaceae bacterium]|nr:DMT family transporter [Colwelliaceae bacterium]
MIKKLIPFLFVLLWSTGFIGAKFGLPYASTGDFLSMRTIANIVVFLLLIIILKQPKLTFKQVLHAMVTGVLIHGAYLGGVFGAIEFGIPAGLTAIIVGLQPLFTATLAIFIFKENITKAQWFALCFGLAGLVLVVSASLELTNVSIIALGFAFIALIGITLGTLYQKRYCQKQPLLTSVCWQYVASLLIFMPLSFMGEQQPVVWHVEFIFSLAWLVLALSVIAILLLMYMVEQGDASKVTTYFYLVPPTTAIEAWLLFDEQLSILSVFGMVLCAVSVYIVNKKSSNAR